MSTGIPATIRKPYFGAHYKVSLHPTKSDADKEVIRSKLETLIQRPGQEVTIKASEGKVVGCSGPVYYGITNEQDGTADIYCQETVNVLVEKALEQASAVVKATFVPVLGESFRTSQDILDIKKSIETNQRRIVPFNSMQMVAHKPQRQDVIGYLVNLNPQDTWVSYVNQ